MAYRAAALGILIAFGAVACTADAPGLDRPTSRWRYTAAPMGPGEGMAFVWGSLSNRRREPIELVSLETVGTYGVPNVIRIDSIEVFRSHLPGGGHHLYPPNLWFDGRCNTGTIVPARGATIPPQTAAGPDVEPLVRLTATGPGTGGFRALRVVYRDGLFTRAMRIPIHVRVEVRRNARTPLADDEKRCLGAPGVKNLLR